MIENVSFPDMINSYYRCYGRFPSKWPEKGRNIPNLVSPMKEMVVVVVVVNRGSLPGRDEHECGI